MRNAEVDRLLDRARRGGGSEAISRELRTLIRDRAGIADTTDGQPLEELADTLIIARWLSARTAGDVGEWIMSPSNRNKKRGKQKRPPFRYRKKAQE